MIVLISIPHIVGSKGAKMVVLGTQQGIWMGKEGDTNGLTRVLMVNDVAQIGVLEAQNILLVLAGNCYKCTCVAVCAILTNVFI